jgi:hypothetical protein
MSAASVRRLIPLAILLPVIVAAGFLPISLPAGDTTIPENANMRPIGEIAAGTTVAAQFPAAASEIASVSMLLATYQRVNQGTLRVTILANRDGQWQEEAVRDVDTATVGDNTYYTLVFPSPVPISAGQRVRIILQSDNPPGQSVTWWRNPDWRQQDYTLTMNGRTLPGEAVFRVAYVGESGRLFSMIGIIWGRATVFLSTVWRIVLVLGLAILVASAFAFTRRLDDSEARVGTFDTGTEERTVPP